MRGVRLVIVACSIAAAPAASSAPRNRTPFEAYDTRGRISSIAIFDYREPNPLAALVPHADFIWGAAKNGWREAKLIARYRRTRPEIILSKYLPMFRDDSQRQPELAPAQKLEWWKRNHPDWIVYRCDRTTPAWEFEDRSNVPLDISNPDVIAWQVQTFGVAARAAGYDALAIDNFSVYNGWERCGAYKGDRGTWVELYPGGTTTGRYRADVLRWLGAMYSALHQLPHPMGIVVNWIPYENDRPLPDRDRNFIVANVDGILDEGSFTHGGKRLVADEEWNHLHTTARYAQSRGKAYWFDNITSEPDDRGILSYLIGSYLVTNEGRAGIWIGSRDAVDAYRPEYATSLGAPCAPSEARGPLHSRGFEFGLVAVNSSSHDTRQFPLPAGRFSDMWGTALASAQALPPRSAVVAITKSRRCSP